MKIENNDRQCGKVAAAPLSCSDCITQYIITHVYNTTQVVLAQR